MLGQFFVEPELVPDDPELELELELVLELDPELVPDVVLVLVEPVFPVVELVELVEPVPEFPVVEVVAALATNAPPDTSPADSAPMASTLRRRMFIGMSSFHLVCIADSNEPAVLTMEGETVANRRTTSEHPDSFPTKR